MRWGRDVVIEPSACSYHSKPSASNTRATTGGSGPRSGSRRIAGADATPLSSGRQVPSGQRIPVVVGGTRVGVRWPAGGRIGSGEITGGAMSECGGEAAGVGVAGRCARESGSCQHSATANAAHTESPITDHRSRTRAIEPPYAPNINLGLGATWSRAVPRSCRRELPLARSSCVRAPMRNRARRARRCRSRPTAALGRGASSDRATATGPSRRRSPAPRPRCR